MLRENINEDYVSYEVAKLLKEKGFDEICTLAYEDLNQLKVMMNWRVASGYLPCPTHQMAMKWLREEHNVHIVIEYHEVDEEGFYGWIVKTGSERNHCHQEFSKYYEEAVEAALKYCLTELI